MTFDELAIQYGNLKIKELDFKELDPEGELCGLCINNKILISNTLSAVEKTCVLAEELGHYYTSFGNILDLRDVRNVKQEKRARNWAYEKLMPLGKLIEASNIGIRNKYELSEFLNVTEEFLSEAIIHYRERYGLHVNYGHYIIYFEPLGVLEKL